MKKEKLEWLDDALAMHEGVGRLAVRDRPERVGIEVTNACNLNCVMCNTKMQSRSPKLMSTENYIRVIEDIARWINPEFVELYTIGETFLHPKLEEFVAIAYANGLEVHLSTNAQYPKQLRSLYERFSDKPPKLFLSVDGATKETFEKIRVGARYERVFECLKAIREINDSSPNAGPFFYIRSILSNDIIPEAREYFDTYGEYLYAPRQINFQLINGISPDQSYFNGAVPEGLAHPKKPCHMPFRNLYYTVDAEVTPCARDYDAKLVVGDLATSDGKAAWFGERTNSLRKAHLGELDFPESSPCNSCFDTYRIARTAANEYIHQHYEAHPDDSGDLMATGIYRLLERLAVAIVSSDSNALRKVIEDEFSLI